jgi:predicted methyltransferase
LNEGSIVKQFNSSLNERVINSRLNELRIDNVLKASANKKQHTNTEIQQIKQETNGIKVKSDLLKEILSEDMITVVQQITSKPEMMLDIAKGM